VERLRAEARRITPGSTDAAVPTVPEPGLLGPSELVEIAGAPGSDAAPFEAARREAIREGRIPVRIATPGRSIIRRLLGIQLAQALALLPEGLSIAEIDAAAEAHGLPAGPFRWIDRLGVRQVLDMMRGLDAAHGPRFRPGDALTWLLEASPSAPPRFRGEDGQAVDARAAQVLGVEWASAERGPANDAVRAEAEDRLVLCMAAEGLRAVRERAVDSADAVDLAAIFGLGYPSIRGGPLRDLTRRGAAGRTRLRELAERHGEAFRAPAETPLTP
jgi:hypothetical protein